MTRTAVPRESEPAPTKDQGSVYRLSRYIHQYHLENGQVAIWNAFWPQPTVVSALGLQALRSLPLDADKWPAETLVGLLGAHIVHTGDEDPSERKFFETADLYLEHIDRQADEMETGGGVYRHLALVNSGCNLGCSYCVSYFGDDAREEAKRDAVRGAAREAAVLNVVEEFLAKVRDTGTLMDDDEHHCRLTFNGGEILLRWSTVKKVLALADEKFPELKIKYHMNTNATLLTPEIARVLAAHDFRVSVSIDEYEELHDQARVYHGGGGSFENVMRGIANSPGGEREPNAGVPGHDREHRGLRFREVLRHEGARVRGRKAGAERARLCRVPGTRA